MPDQAAGIPEICKARLTGTQWRLQSIALTAGDFEPFGNAHAAFIATETEHVINVQGQLRMAYQTAEINRAAAASM